MWKLHDSEKVIYLFSLVPFAHPEIAALISVTKCCETKHHFRHQSIKLPSNGTGKTIHNSQVIHKSHLQKLGEDKIHWFATK